MKNSMRAFPQTGFRDHAGLRRNFFLDSPEIEKPPSGPIFDDAPTSTTTEPNSAPTGSTPTILDGSENPQEADAPPRPTVVASGAPASPSLAADAASESGTWTGEKINDKLDLGGYEKLGFGKRPDPVFPALKPQMWKNGPHDNFADYMVRAFPVAIKSLIFTHGSLGLTVDQTKDGSFVLQGQIQNLRALAENFVGREISSAGPAYICIAGIAARNIQMAPFKMAFGWRAFRDVETSLAERNRKRLARGARSAGASGNTGRTGGSASCPGCNHGVLSGSAPPALGGSVEDDDAADAALRFPGHWRSAGFNVDHYSSTAMSQQRSAEKLTLGVRSVPAFDDDFVSEPTWSFGLQGVPTWSQLPDGEVQLRPDVKGRGTHQAMSCEHLGLPKEHTMYYDVMHSIVTQPDFKVGSKTITKKYQKQLIDDLFNRIRGMKGYSQDIHMKEAVENFVQSFVIGSDKYAVMRGLDMFMRPTLVNMFTDLAKNAIENGLSFGTRHLDLEFKVRGAADDPETESDGLLRVERDPKERSFSADENPAMERWAYSGRLFIM